MKTNIFPFRDKDQLDSYCRGLFKLHRKPLVVRLRLK